MSAIVRNSRWRREHMTKIFVQIHVHLRTMWSRFFLRCISCYVERLYTIHRIVSRYYLHKQAIVWIYDFAGFLPVWCQKWTGRISTGPDGKDPSGSTSGYDNLDCQVWQTGFCKEVADLVSEGVHLCVSFIQHMNSAAFKLTSSENLLYLLGVLLYRYFIKQR